MLDAFKASTIRTLVATDVAARGLDVKDITHVVNVDFPGTINGHYQHFISSVLDVAKSLAYHGFKKIVLLNGHGSNAPNLDLAARRVNLETDGECIPCSWWQLLTIDPDFLPSWRESRYPGGCAHAGELETSVYMYLDGNHVRKDKIKDGAIAFNVKQPSKFRWVDLFAAGPGTPVSWTASYSDTGVLGQAELATPEKGEQAVNEAAKQLAAMVQEFKARPNPRAATTTPRGRPCPCPGRPPARRTDRATSTTWTDYLRDTTTSIHTAPISTSPRAMYFISGDTANSVMPLSRLIMISAPNNTPITVPRPPLRLVPPMTQAAIASSSIKSPTVVVEAPA